MRHDHEVALGERVIITDLTPVIESMPLEVRPAPEVEDYLRRRALGSDR